MKNHNTAIGIDKLQRVVSSLTALDDRTVNSPAESTQQRLAELRKDARSALDWLEDTAYFDVAHACLDAVGHATRIACSELCELPLVDGLYHQQCPVALAHTRVGLSTAFRVTSAECSICAQDVWECPHTPGDEYAGTECAVVITEAEIVEVSLVARPRMPDARITRQSLSHGEIEQQIGGPVPTGAILICDRCLHECPGMSHPLGR